MLSDSNWFSDSEFCDRLCVTSATIQHLDILEVDHSDGCRNISLLPGVSPHQFICFCSSQLCNDASRETELLWTSMTTLLLLLLQQFVRWRIRTCTIMTCGVAPFCKFTMDKTRDHFHAIHVTYYLPSQAILPTNLWYSVSNYGWSTVQHSNVHVTPSFVKTALHCSTNVISSLWRIVCNRNNIHSNGFTFCLEII